MGYIFYVMGKSASGKDTIYNELKEILALKTIVLYTTRPIREGEVNGDSYHFISDEILNDFIARNRVIELREYNTVHGVWKYATIDDKIDIDKNNYIAIGTLESFNKLKTYYNAEVMVPIFIDVDDGIRLERALRREQKQKSPKYAELCRRYLADEDDFSEENIITSGITHRFLNVEKDVCVNEIEAYIREMIYSE